MTETTTPPIFPWIYNNLAWILPLTVAISTGAAFWVRKMILNKIKSHGIRLRNIERIIPPEALPIAETDRGKMLQTVSDCQGNQTRCPKGSSDTAAIAALNANMEKMITAMTKLINRLPLKDEDREEISLELK